MKRKIITGISFFTLLVLVAGCSAPPVVTQPPPPPPPQVEAAESEETATPVIESEVEENTSSGFVLDNGLLDSLSYHEGWARVPFNFGVFGGYGVDQMSDVVGGGPGIVAGGYAVRGGEMDAVIWYSQNAVDWLRIDDPANLGGPGSQLIAGLASGPGGLVAVGWEQQGSELDAAAWFSVDGLEWSRVNAAALGGSGSQGLNAVLALGDGFVAVGWEEDGEETRAAVWATPNGRSWTRVAHAENVFGGQAFYANLQDIIQVGDALLAVGVLEPVGEERDVDTGIWASNDGGASWARITNSDPVLGDGDSVRYQIAGGVTYGNNLFILGAAEQNVPGSLNGEYSNAAIYTSRDGINWQRVFDHKPDQRQQTLLDVAGADGGFWAVGYEVLGEQAQAVVWYSADGQTWSQVPHSESTFGGNGLQRINALAPAGPGLVAVGITYENGEEDAAAWIYVPGK